MSKINEKSCVVIMDKTMYPNSITMTPEEFIKAATSSGGFEIEGDLFFYIPDFTEAQYKMLSGALDGIIWFSFSKEEIPHWVSPNSIQILENPRAMAQASFTQTPQPNMFVAPQAPQMQPQQASPFIDPTQMMQQAPVQPQMQQVPTPQMMPQQAPPQMATQAPQMQQQPQAPQTSAFDEAVIQDVQDLFEAEETVVDNNGDKEAKIFLFGSSKGGTGKTFTCLISAYRYAKIHPGQKVCVFDADITDPQVSISIHKINPTLYNYWTNWSNGNRGFQFMEACKCQNSNFPANLDFYLAPKDYVINNDKYWLDVLNNLISNYDVVFIDSGIDYINIPLISYCYKIADRIVLVSTTSIKSTSSVLKQINRLKGKIPSLNSEGKNVYSAEDEIGPKLRLAITGYLTGDAEDRRQNKTIIDSFSKNIKINALFGHLSSQISKAEFSGRWNIFDNNQKFNESLDRLVDMAK